MNKKQKNKSSTKQEKVIKKLDEMSEKNVGTSKFFVLNDKPMENMETLRQILENLITLSFDQEELIHNISSLPKNNNKHC